MPVTIIAECGINHNADLSIAYKMIDVAYAAGVDYIKFQKRNPDLCVPEDQKNIPKETPWGKMTYLEYKRKMEFSLEQYQEIDDYCEHRGIKWFASAWDVDSLAFLKSFEPDYIKVPSALMENFVFLNYCKMLKVPVIMSTGMCDYGIIDNAIRCVGAENVAGLLHCTSTYPTKTEELNLSCIPKFKSKYPFKIGFSNHHPGIVYMPVAVALGAEIIEMHITLDRSSWGTDQAASIEPEGLYRTVKYIRQVELALGTGVKCIYESEVPIMKKLRK